MMPILSSIPTTRLTQEEFGELAYEVMQHVFAIHSDFGRFFDEAVYKKELAVRMSGVSLEAPVELGHRTFSKLYFANVIVRGGALFEFKASEAIHPKHRSQGIHYLLLFDLPHGKIVNVRTEQVEHEFVNCHQRLADLRDPLIQDNGWNDKMPGAEAFRDTLTALFRDWGSGLELSAYEEALTHFLGDSERVNVPVPVFGSSGHLTGQRMRLAAPDVAFKLTALPDREEAFVTHARRLIQHTSLKAIHWANIRSNRITYTTIL